VTERAVAAAPAEVDAAGLVSSALAGVDAGKGRGGLRFIAHRNAPASTRFTANDTVKSSLRFMVVRVLTSAHSAGNYKSTVILECRALVTTSVAPKSSRSRRKNPPPSGCIFSRENHPFPKPFRMKAKIIITPKKAVVDPQGITVKKALEHMGYSGVTGVHIGKYIEIDLAPGTDKAAAHKAINDAAHKLLSNPVIEDYKLEMVE
jgi:phosphoribosylformylglycinamidine synthase subunit PurS